MKCRKRYILLFITTVLLALFVLYSCNEPNINNNIVSKEGDIKKLKKHIGPDALSCDQRVVYVWEFDHYEPKNGKELGFWPHPYANMADMKTKYGFTNVLVRNNAERDTAINAGFELHNIVAQINRNNFTYPSGNFDY